jgi:hypothetical protein
MESCLVYFARNISLLSLLIVVAARMSEIPLHAAEPVRSGSKKLIEMGYDMPDTAFLRDNIESMKKEPFDGVVFSARPSWGVNQELTWGAWGKKRFTRAEMQHAVDELKATNFGRYKENFLRLNMYPADLDWFDDFDTVLGNVGTAAWLVTQGGAKGIFFDTENYNDSLWRYTSQKNRDKKTFEEYQAQVRKRGQEVMKAMQAENPNLLLMIPVSYSYVWGPSQINGDLKKLPTIDYGLMPAFLDGMLDAAAPGVRFIDSFENAYGYRTRAEFETARERMASGTLPIVADKKRYAEKVSFGFAVWLDAFWRSKGDKRWHADPNEFHLNYYQPDDFGKVVADAMAVTDEYVWVYSEQLFWRSANTGGSPDVPKAYEDAIRKAAQSSTDESR